MTITGNGPSPLGICITPLIVNPSLGPDELLEELAARLQQVYGSLDALAVRANNDGAELIYDALWARREDVYQIQNIRDALEERLSPAGQPVGLGDSTSTRH